MAARSLALPSQHVLHPDLASLVLLLGEGIETGVKDVSPLCRDHLVPGCGFSLPITGTPVRLLSEEQLVWMLGSGLAKEEPNRVAHPCCLWLPWHCTVRLPV